MTDLLIYGATGYTGRLIAHAAATAGLPSLLAGRDAGRVAAVAAEVGLPWRAFRLDDAAALGTALLGARVVLNCAGPYGATARPMAEACLAAGCHYLDLAGEIDAIETLAARGAEARAAGVMLLPAVGFDLVPTDCLAVHVSRRLAGATHLAVAVQHPPWRDARGRRRAPTMSRGTAATLVSSQLAGGAIRQDGAIVPTGLAARRRRIDLGAGPTGCYLFPLAEVAALYHSTGIPNVEAYVAMPRPAALALRHLAPLLRRLPLARLLPRPGPGAEELARGVSLAWAEARDETGRVAVARLRSPSAYTYTVESAVAAARRVLAGEALPGFQTPATAFGPDFALEVAGTSRQDESVVRRLL